MRKSLVALSVLSAAIALPAQAEYHYGFANVYGDYLNWEQGFEEVERPSHFALGAEAGAGFSWGEVYGFYEFEKLNMGSNERSQAAKFSVHYKLVGDFTAYAQVYNLIDNKYSSEQNRVIGVGYTGLTGDNFWFKPFIGVHDVSAAQYVKRDAKGDPIKGTEIDANGLNGYMAGWNAGYSFDVAGLPLMINNWHEIEFDRNDGYAASQNGKVGHNGAVGLWMDINERIYTGVQYRYFYNKLGWEGYGDAMIWRLGVHL